MSDPVTAQGGEERHPATDSDVETDELAERVSEPRRSFDTFPRTLRVPVCE